ncbi:MAG: YegS/Rv2252/BmrU family lipid kinase [Clostridia bacterium]|nr:YegS/Rv2252/BmrU family lipid kinase [Clostridia bacterium]
MERLLLMYNPASGGGKRIKSMLDGIIEIFQAKDKFITTYRLDHTTPSTLEEVLDAGDFDGVLVCGGDGSAKFVGGLLSKKGLDIPLGVLPNGTCNDFARSLGLPNDLLKSAKILAEGRTKWVDVGLINNEEYFVNEIAGGMMVGVSYNVEDSLKQTLGPLAYYIAGMNELTKLKTYPLHIETVEGRVYDIDAYLFLALNGRDAAGMTGLSKDAVMDDGKMDIIIFKKSNLIDVTDTLLKFVTTSDFQEKCVERIVTAGCTVTCAVALNTTVDGEKGPQAPLHIEMLPRKLNVMY